MSRPIGETQAMLFLPHGIRERPAAGNNHCSPLSASECRKPMLQHIPLAEAAANLQDDHGAGPTGDAALAPLAMAHDGNANALGLAIGIELFHGDANTDRASVRQAQSGDAFR